MWFVVWLPIKSSGYGELAPLLGQGVKLIAKHEIGGAAGEGVAPRSVSQIASDLGLHLPTTFARVIGSLAQTGMSAFGDSIDDRTRPFAEVTAGLLSTVPPSASSIVGCDPA